jgi:selenocysteine lyase/cysteine desulfurase
MKGLISVPHRRSFLQGAAGTLIGLASGCATSPDRVAEKGDGMDTGFWRSVRADYDLPDDVIQLENGAWGVMSRPVKEAYFRHQAWVNRQGSYYTRRQFGTDATALRTRVAASLGVNADEIAFSRNATEALQALIGGYNRLKPGDGVLLSDLDYDSMQTAMRWLSSRRGAQVHKILLPEPASKNGIVSAYEAALIAHQDIRLILLTHVSHRNGVVMPVREITALARARGVDVILDSAHAWGQVDVRLDDMGTDFAGFNLHKWIGAPIGVGLMFIRRGRLADIDPFMGEPEGREAAIDTRLHTGTTNFAALLSVADALDYHENIGADRKAARLRFLADSWTEPARSLPGIDIISPTDPALRAGIAAFRRSGETSIEENRALADRLLKDFGIFTVVRSGLAAGACVRVTPGIFTSEAEIRDLLSALKEIGR